MNQNILNGIQGKPEVMQAVSMAAQEMLNDPDIDRKSVEQMIRMLEFVMQNPDSYNEFRQTAIQGGMLDPEDLPEQFSSEMLTVVLLALKVVQQQMADGGPGFARGGLNRIAQMGRRGDSELAHINPFERRLLESYGGSGTINPKTGLREFGWFKKAFKAIAPALPIILAIAAPGVGIGLGSALSGGALAGNAAGMLGSAAIGGLSSAASGGDALQGAIGGALGAGGASALGEGVSNALGANLGSTAQNVLGSSLAGAAQGSLSGQGLSSGALQGALGGYTGSTLADAASGVDGALGAGLKTAGMQTGNALTMGADPQQALTQGALSGLAAGLSYDKPSDLAIKSIGEDQMMQTPDGMGKMRSEFEPGDMALNPETGESYMPAGQSPLAKIASTTQGDGGAANKGFSLGNAASMLPLLSLFGSAQTPEEVQQVVSKMTPEQQEYFNRPLRTWNWDTLSAAAKMQNLPVGSYIARNWDKVGGGSFDNPEPIQTLARGGALSRLASGGGSGRDDTIPARLSDGEYVMDAETVSMLGDGSTKDGARRLDEMRAKIRQHKGKSMARGKFSANAKSPLAYLKGA
jgi:hypothetical protein